MKIIHIASEMAPIAKVGGLGDVIHGLSRALLHQNQTVEVLLPRYQQLDCPQRQVASFPSYYKGNWRKNLAWRTLIDQIPVTLIDAPEFFDRDQIYGYPDDVMRFAYFCLASLDYLETLPTPPDVIHIHDWHTALIPLLIQQRFVEMNPKLIFTIHNLAYQGICTEEVFTSMELDGSLLRDQEHYNLLKGGICYADRVTTVSPNYAKEILTTEMGGALQPTLQKYKEKFSGILNGIDYDFWNPAQDPHLPYHFTRKNLKGDHHPLILAKRKIKQALRAHFRLQDSTKPLVSAITRLVTQKGPELIETAIRHTLKHNGQFVLLGSALDPKMAQKFENLKKEYEKHPDIHLELTFNEPLSHQLFAGADLLIVPSLFEPCGLTQMVAMRHGTVPLVRATGGLADTVIEGENGFSFEKPTSEAIKEALDRAFECWTQTPQKWRQLMEVGMEQDFSWEHPAQAYMDLYASPSLNDRRSQATSQRG